MSNLLSKRNVVSNLQHQDNLSRISIIDEDYDVIEREMFGREAIHCLKIMPESYIAPPQGSPFLNLAESLSGALQRYVGFYSIK